MAIKYAGKGSAFQVTISSVLTTVASAISIDAPEQKMETFDADSLDNTDAGIIHAPTMRTEGGEAQVEFFYDPGTASHQIFTTWINEVTLANMTKVCCIKFGQTPAGTWTFTGVGCSVGAQVKLNDGIKATAKVKLSKTISV